MTCLSAKGATGVGNSIDVRDARHITVIVSAPANASLTYKFQAALGDTPPTFSSAQTGSNQWEYIAVYDAEDPSSIIAGDTGVTINNDTEANNERMFFINSDNIDWLNMNVTAFTDGSVTSKVRTVTEG